METKLKNTIAVILAAGVSSRMKTDTPKVLFEVCSKPMLSYVLDACRAVGIEKIYVVVGFGAELVEKRFADADDITWVLQAEQKGTGHAVLCCKEHLKDFDGLTFVLCGDGPLIRPQILEDLAQKHNGQTSAALATAIIDDPAGYGRIVRNRTGDLEKIVEHKECTEDQLEIKEINPSYYLFDNKALFDSLEKINNDNVQGEYYLTDVFEILLNEGKKVAVVTAVRPEEAMSVNTKQQLDKMNEIMCKRLENRDAD